MQTNLCQPTLESEILIFKTNIETDQRLEQVSPILDAIPSLATWSVDTEDIDNVLRIITKGDLFEFDIIYLLTTQGFYCEPLTD